MPHALDDLSFITKLDPKGMYALTTGFPNQCRRALEIAQATEIPLSNLGWSHVVLTGLGGSAAGGDIVRSIFDAEATVPFAVNRDYTLPAYVSENTLVFATSYSGNTEETLSAYADAKQRGATVIAVTSGGKLAELAQSNGDPVIVIPAGQPPRTALGFMLVPVVHACEHLGLIESVDHASTYSLLEACTTDWGVETPFESNSAKQLAARLHGAVSVLYGLGGWQGLVANRWKGQINENAKNMTFANTFPELNHNEILGWVATKGQGVDRWVAVLLESGFESAKMKTRAAVTQSLTESVCEWHTVRAVGNSLYERILSLTFLGDFVSLYLAALNEVDPETIDSINILKTELSKIIE